MYVKKPLVTFITSIMKNKEEFNLILKNTNTNLKQEFYKIKQ